MYKNHTLHVLCTAPHVVFTRIVDSFCVCIKYGTMLTCCALYRFICNNNRKHGAAAVQEGSMRCDVNVSVRPTGQQRLGTKVEVKNMNSFSAMQKAIDFEIDRQVCVLTC